MTITSCFILESLDPITCLSSAPLHNNYYVSYDVFNYVLFPDNCINSLPSCHYILSTLFSAIIYSLCVGVSLYVDISLCHVSRLVPGELVRWSVVV